MNKIFIILCLLSFSVMAESSLSKRYSANINQIEKTVGSFQETLELDIYNGTSYLAPYISYTTKNNLEISIQSQNINIGGPQVQNFENDTYLGLGKFFEINSHNAIILSSQLGISTNDKQHFHEFSSIDYKYRPVKWFIIHGGIFHVNQNLSTTFDYFGGFTGFELNGDILKLNVDYYGGHSNVSGGSAVLTYKEHKWIRPYIGVAFPEKNSGNEFYGIIGLSLIQ